MDNTKNSDQSEDCIGSFSNPSDADIEELCTDSAIASLVPLHQGGLAERNQSQVDGLEKLQTVLCEQKNQNVTVNLRVNQIAQQNQYTYSPVTEKHEHSLISVSGTSNTKFEIGSLTATYPGAVKDEQVNHSFQEKKGAPKNDHVNRSFQETQEMERDFIALFNGETEKNTADNITGTFEEQLSTPSRKVDPEYFENKFYRGETASTAHDYTPDLMYESSEEPINVGKKVQMSQFLDDVRYTALIGSMGSGKSTSAKRFARLVLEKKIPSLEHIKLVHFVNIADLNWEKRLTAYDLIFHQPMGDKAIRFKEFGQRWILEHGNEVLLVLDGLDQSPKDIWKCTTKVAYDTKAATPVILHNLFGGNLISKCKIVTTSRAEGLRTCPLKSQPDKTISISQLQSEDCEYLIKELGGQRGGEIWKYLEHKAPGLLSLCRTPVYLVFTVACFEDFENVPDTTTGILIRVLLLFMNSENQRVRNIHKVFNDLCDLAFKGTCNHKLIFGPEDLSSSYLKPSDVSDFVKTTPRKTSLKLFRLVEGNKQLTFIHQSVQEALTALHIVKMKYEDFKACILDYFDKPLFRTVRNIVAGILLNDRVNSEINLDTIGKIMEVEEKKEYLKDWIEKQVIQNQGKDDTGLCQLLVECDSSVRNFISKIYTKFSLEQELHGIELHSIFTIMAHCHNIHSANFFRLTLNQVLFDAFLSALKNCNNLRVNQLNVTDCKVTGVKMLQLFEHLGQCNAKLREFCLNGITSEESQTFMHVAQILDLTKAATLGLQSCNLSGDKLEKLMKEIANRNVKLRKLWLIENSIVEPESFKHIAKILKISQTKILIVKRSDLSQDNLRAFSQSLAKQKIKLLQLYITIDEIKDCKESFMHLAKLVDSTKPKSLDICDSRLTLNNMKLLYQAIADCKVKIKEFWINGSVIEDYVHVAKILDSTNAVAMCFRDCELSSDKFRLLLKELTDHKIQLRKLVMNGIAGMEPASLKHLAKMLEMTQAKTLILQRCDLSQEKLLNFTQSLNCRIKLEILFITLDPNMDYRLLAKVAHLTGTKSLVICNSELSQDNALSLSQALADGKVKLQGFELNEITITEPEAFTHIAEILDSTKAKFFGLQDNHLIGDHFQKLSQEVARRNVELKKLTLFGNPSIEPSCFNYIAKILEVTHTKILIMRKNELSQEDEQRFSWLLENHNIKLSRLDITIDQTMDCESIIQVAKVIESTKTKSLGICDGELSKDSMGQLTQALKHRSIKIRDIWLNGVATTKPDIFVHVAQMLYAAKVETLGFLNCELSGSDIWKLSGELAQNKAKLRSLCLMHNVTIKQPAFRHFAKILMTTRTEILMLKGIELTHDNWLCFSHSLRDYNIKLRQLHISMDQIKDSESFTHVARVVDSTRTQSLTLCDSQLTQQNMQLLSQALLDCRAKLTELWLKASTARGPETFANIAKILDSTKTGTLALQFCDFSVAEFQKLSEEVSKQDVKLRKLLLIGNPAMQPESFEHLAEILNSTQIKTLVLKRCALSQEKLQKFSQSLAKRDIKLQQLHITMDQTMEPESFISLAKILDFTKCTSLTLCNSELFQDDMQQLCQALTDCNVKLERFYLSGATITEPQTIFHLLKILHSTKAGTMGLQACSLPHEKLDQLSQALPDLNMEDH